MLSNIELNIIIKALTIRKAKGEDPKVILENYTKLTEEEKQAVLDSLD